MLLLLLGVGFGIKLPSRNFGTGHCHRSWSKRKWIYFNFWFIVGNGCFFGQRLHPIVKLPKEKILSLLISVQKGLGTLFANPIRALLLIGLSMVIWLCTIWWFNVL